MSLVRKLAGETVIYGMGNVLPRLLNWVILTPFYTNYFEDQSEFGIVNILYSYLAFTTVLFTFRMETTFFRFGSKVGQINISFSTASIAVIAITLIGTLCLYFNIPLLASLINIEQSQYLKWPILVLAFDALAAIPFARLRLENRPVRFAIYKIASVLINLFFVLFFLLIIPWLIDKGWTEFAAFRGRFDDVEFIFLANLLASGTILLLLSPQYRHLFSKEDRSKLENETLEQSASPQPKSHAFFSWLLLGKMLKYAYPLVIVGLAGIINQLSGYPTLDWWGGASGKKMAGIYSGGARLAVIMTLFTQAFNYAAEPFFFKNTNRKDADDIYAQVAQIFTLVASLAYLGVICFIEIIQYFIGDAYREGLVILPILLLAYLFLGLFYNFAAWYKLEDKTYIGSYIAAGGALLTILINWLLIPPFGIFGPAFAALGCYTFMIITTYIIGRRYRPIPYPLKSMTFYLLLAITGVTCSSLLRTYLEVSDFTLILINTLIFLVVAAIMLYSEKELLKSLIKRE